MSRAAPSVGSFATPFCTKMSAKLHEAVAAAASALLADGAAAAVANSFFFFFLFLVFSKWCFPAL